MAYYLAKIEVLLWTDNETDACDAISETLRPLLQEFDLDSPIIDWRYAPSGDPAPDSGTGFEYSAIGA